MKNIRIYLLTSLAIILGLLFIYKEDTPNPNNISVVTSLFPQYDFTREIAGENIDLELLLKPGVEAHSYEPSPRDIIRIKNSSLFIYTNDTMEPWVERIKNELGEDGPIIVNISEGIDLIDHGDHDHDGHNHDDHDHSHHEDPHIWLDPKNAIKISKTITDSLSEVDPVNKEFYMKNYEAYKKKLQDLDRSIEEGLAPYENRTLVYGGHFVFGYFIEAYDLDYISPYSGISPDAEASPRTIVNIIEEVKNKDIGVVYYEELVDPKVAKLIAEETGADLLLLHGGHNLSRDEIKDGLTYLDIMYANLENLKKGLEYE